MADPAADARIARRAAALLPEEAAPGSDDPDAQAKVILEESDERSNREAAPDSFVEHRTSDEATPPG
jgi:hypothetical protein